VKTDQQALKYLLEQKVAIVPQQRWIFRSSWGMTSLSSIKRIENRVADALSRQFETPSGPAELSLSLISFPTPTWVDDLKATYAQDPETRSILLTLQQNKPGPKGFSLQRGLLLKKGRLWIIKHSPFQLQILEFIHSNPTVGITIFHTAVLRVLLAVDQQAYKSSARLGITQDNSK